MIHRSSQSNVAFHSVMVVVAILLVLGQPLASLAQTSEETTTVSDSEPTTETIAAATEEGATGAETATEVPTEIVTETPTVVATEPATETAPATVVPTETPPATDAPAEEATATETPVPAESETVPASSFTATPTPTEEAESGKKLKTSDAGVSIATTGSDCTQIAGGSTVTVGQYVTFRCNDDHPFKIQGNVSSGWQWAHSWGTVIVPTDWQDGFFAPSETSNNTSYFLYLGPHSDAQIGSTGSLSITVRHPNRNMVKNTHLVTTERAPSASDFDMSCSPNTVTVLTGEVATVNCSIRANNVSPFTVFAVAGISISSVPGWTITRTPSIGLFSGFSPFTFKVTLKPTCGAQSSPTKPNISIASTLVYGFRSFDGPTTSITAKHGATSTVTTAITGSNVDWSRTYSFDPQLVNGSVTYQVVSNGCAGWSVQVTATELTYTGSANGSAIASANIAVTPGTPTAVSGSTTNVSVGAAGTLNAPINVLTANERSGAGAYNQTLGLGVTIPGGARVGTYTSTLTITAASGP